MRLPSINIFLGDSLMDEFVTIINFEKFNDRHKEVKNPSWFRLQNSLFEHPDFLDFTHTEIVAWIYLLSLVSKKNNSTVLLSWSHIERVANIRKKDFKSALEKLEKIQAITRSVPDPYHIRPGDGTGMGRECPATLQDTTEQDITNKTLAVLDFEKLYEKYPKKEGKGKGLIIAKRDINTLADFNLLETAIEKYSAKCKKDRTESRFIKQFSTFMNSWRDWIEPDAGEIKFQKKNVVPEKPKSYQPTEEPFTPEQQKTNKKRIADLLKTNGLGGWSDNT